MSDYRDLQQHHQLMVADVDLATSTDSDPDTTLLTARSANHRIWVQKITLSIITHAAATVQFEDTANTPVVIASHVDAAAAAGVPSVVHWDFGVVGTPLTLGKDLELSVLAAGVAARVHVEGYQKLVGPVAAASTN